MRITSGQFRGRNVKVPHGDRIRPTQDRVREALFSMLLAELQGARFIDLFAGTGAVGIEALSRGAGEVVWVEGDRSAHRLAVQNIVAIAGERYASNAICADVMRFLGRPNRYDPYDIIFADPPYAMASADGLASVARLAAENGYLADGGLFIAETSIDAPVEEIEGFTLLRDRTYGKTRLTIRQRIASGGATL